MAFKSVTILRTESGSFLNCVPGFGHYDVSIWLRHRSLVLGSCDASGYCLVTFKRYSECHFEGLCALCAS